MKDLRFRAPKAEELEIRVQQAKNGKTKLLTYIDSRAAVLLLNETVGAYGWQSDFKEVNGLTICQLSIWDGEKQQWITKSDTGSESNIEANKGLISDAYKRCLARWGFTCLYTAPEIVLPYEDKFAKLKVSEVTFDSDYADGNMTRLILVDRNNKEVFKWDKENGTTCNAEVPLEYNPDSKPPVKKDSKPIYKLTTVDELHDFCNARVKEVGGELRKPIIEFAKNFGDKTEKMLPLNNAMAVWLSWLGKENNPIIREGLEALKNLWHK